MHSHCLTTLGRLPRATLLVFIASWGCGGSSSEPTKVKPPIQNLPARITVVTAPKTTAQAGSDAGDFVVRVETVSGEGLPNQHVQFGQTSGASGFVFAPYTATTDSAGVARTTVTYRTTVGTDQLTASADGLSTPVLVPVTITPAPPAYVVVTPSAVTLFGAGDTASFQVKVTDMYLNVRPEVTPVLSVSDSTALSVTAPAAFGANGAMRSLKGGVTVTLNATALTLPSGKLTVGIYPNSRNVCAGITPQSVSFGVPFAVTDSVVCLPATSGTSTYALMVYNASTDGTATLGTTVTGTNVALPPPSTFARIGTRPSLTRLRSLSRLSNGPTPDLRFHQRLLEQSRSLRRLFGPARMARSFARPGSMGRIRGPSYSLGSASTLPAVGDLIPLNVSSDPCTTPDIRTFSVRAVGDKAIVLADTGNPIGFTVADYQRFAARFDQLVYPVDVNAFDAPTDIDGNGHVAILFTRAVNELTPANSGYYVGGFFNPRDLFPRTQSATLAVCPTSNEGEMFYMMVPDPTGVVNGNRFRIGFVDTLTTAILAHEFQHLINAGRRMYVNTSATDFEDIWLNEGLSHEAQELLFFQESYYNPRLRLGASVIGDTQQHFDMWVSDDATNFQNFWLYLSDPANHSPIDANDDIETRGAAWAFLRFAADLTYSNDAVVWKRFVNSTTTGIGTLTYALQTDPTPVLQAFALANMTKGHTTWNFADIYTRLFVGGSYPLAYGALQEGTAVQATARGGSASYYQFKVLDNAQALLRFGSTAAPADPNLKFVLLRTD